MKRDKYMGLDVHQAMTVVAVMNAEGKIVLETMALVNKVVSGRISGLLLKAGFKHGVELMKCFLDTACDFEPATVFQ